MSDIPFLFSLNEDLVAFAASGHYQTLGAAILVHTEENGIPDLEGIQVAIIGVLEDRLSENSSGKVELDFIRKAFYALFPGNWHTKVADLGNIYPGETVEDTYFAVQKIVSELIKKDIIPIVIGGSQDLVYAQYRAYDNLDQMVNLVNIDSRFDLGDADKPISNKSYVGKIVVTKPYNLFNYSNIGYQTYYNSQDEIDLIEKLYFDAFRLGEVTGNIYAVEPILRDANLVSIDIGAIGNPHMQHSTNSPNGFDGREICALARYAGISDKVSSIGIYECQEVKNNESSCNLIAQMMWYFIEGVNFRNNENTISAKKEFVRYRVPIDDDILTFYKSPNSSRWWIEIPFVNNLSNKLERNTLLPCTEDDYIDACNQIMPERWYKAKRKNEIL